MLTTIITVVYIGVCIFMILSILLQAGKGGGMGSALGGGASQNVFGGGGGADFMAKLTQGFAIAFMVGAIYLAYAGSHSGSDFLRDRSEDLNDEQTELVDGASVDFENVAAPGGRVMQLTAYATPPTAQDKPKEPEVVVPALPAAQAQDDSPVAPE